MKKVLKQEFFERDACRVARELLGKYLVRAIPSRDGRPRHRAYMIIETEAYVGPYDKASHAHRGRTARTEAMFGEPGRFYVYLVYGMYWMLNIVTDATDYPSAVLIRAVVSTDTTGNTTRDTTKKQGDYSIVLQNNRIRTMEVGSTDGPGKVARELHVDKRFNAKKAERASGLWVEDRGVRIPAKKILRLPRVGVAYAKEWAAKPYRYMLKD